MSAYTWACTALTLSRSFIQCITLPLNIPWQCVRCRREITSQKLFQGQDGFSDIRGKPHRAGADSLHVLHLPPIKKPWALRLSRILSLSDCKLPPDSSPPRNCHFLDTLFESYLIKVASKFACSDCRKRYVDLGERNTKMSHIIAAQSFSCLHWSSHN